MPSHSHAHPTILNRNEFERIKSSIVEVPPDNHEIVRRKELKNKSNERLKHWPNTLEALREKKLNFIKEKQEQEEAKRVELDIIEENLRKKRSEETKKRAEDFRFECTDQMKLFRRQEQYAACLIDRRQQIERKSVKKDEEVIHNKFYHEKILEKVAELTAVEEEKKKKVADNVVVIKAAREEQIADVRARKEAERLESIAIGEAMKRQAIEQVEQEKRAVEERAKQIAINNANMVIANEKLKAVRAEILQKEKEAEAARDGEVELIDNRKKARKVIEIRRFEKQQETRQALIDRAIKQLQAKSNKDQEIQEKQEAEIKERQDKAIADKEAKRQAQWNAIVASRTEQIEAREERRRIEMEEDEKQIGLWNAVNQSEIQKAKDRDEAARRTTKVIKDMQYNDGIIVARKRAKERLDELEEYRRARANDGVDDKKYQELVKSKIIEYSIEGKPTYTLMKALDYKQPDLIGAKLNKGVSGKTKKSEE